MKGLAQALEYAAGLDVVLIPYEMAEGMEATKRLISSVSRDSQSEFLSVRKADLRRKRSKPQKNMGAASRDSGKKNLAHRDGGINDLVNSDVSSGAFRMIFTFQAEHFR